jgi:hypothetical protein
MKRTRYTTDNGNIIVDILTTSNTGHESLSDKIADFIPTKAVQYTFGDESTTLYLTELNIQIFIETGVWTPIE